MSAGGSGLNCAMKHFRIKPPKPEQKNEKQKKKK